MTAYLMPAMQTMKSDFHHLSSSQYDFSFSFETISQSGTLCGQGSNGTGNAPAIIHVTDGQIFIDVGGFCHLSGPIDDNGDFTINLSGLDCPGLQDNGCNQQTGQDSCCSRVSSSVDITGHFDGNSLTGSVHSVAVANPSDPDCAGNSGSCVADNVLSAEKI